MHQLFAGERKFAPDFPGVLQTGHFKETFASLGFPSISQDKVLEMRRDVNDHVTVNSYMFRVNNISPD
jgi:hypothetical protein